MYYVYLIQNELGELYSGSTNNLKRQFIEHNSGRSTYTKGNKWHLLYYEAYLAETDARMREKSLKLHAQAMSALKKRLQNTLKQV